MEPLWASALTSEMSVVVCAPPLKKSVDEIDLINTMVPLNLNRVKGV